MRKNRSISDLQRLDKLARDIRSRAQNTSELAAAAAKRHCETIAEALLCVCAIEEARALVGRADWPKWIANHCHGVKEQEVRALAAIARRKRVSEGLTLRKTPQAPKALPSPCHPDVDKRDNTARHESKRVLGHPGEFLGSDVSVGHWTTHGHFHIRENPRAETRDYIL